MNPLPRSLLQAGFLPQPRLLLLSFLFTMVTGLSPMAASATDESRQPTAGAGLVKALPAIKTLQDKIPVEYLSLDGLVEAAEFDATKIVEHINTNMSVQPYHGVMQHNQAVIMSAQGNALELSRLLLGALELAGYEARIVEATLDAKAVDTLLLKLFETTEAERWQLAAEDAEAALVNIGAAMGNKNTQALVTQYNEISNAISWQQSPLKKRSAAMAGKLQQILTANNVTLGSDVVMQEVRAALRSYYFVQYRMDVGQEWQSAYPGFATRPENLQEKNYLRDVPDELYSKITIQAFVETKQGEKTSTQAVSAAMRFLAADLIERDLGYSAIPDSLIEFMQNPERQIDIADVRVFLPTLNGAPMDGARAFSLDGKVMSVAEAFDDMGKLGSAVDKNLSGVMDTLGSSTNENLAQQPKNFLVAHYLEITSQSPGSGAEVVRRYFYQQGADVSQTRKAFDVSQRLLVGVKAHAYTPAVQLHKQLQRMSAFISALGKIADTPIASTMSVGKILENSLSGIEDPRFSIPLVIENMGLTSTETVLRTGPYVAGIWNRSTGEGLQDEKLIHDVIFDPAIALRKTDSQVKVDAASNLVSGTWLTYAEAAAINGIDTKRNAFNPGLTPAAEQFESASAAGVKLEQTLPVIAHQDQRYIYLVAGRGPADVPFYRIDLGTGRALGFGPEGLGSVSAETLLEIKVLVAYTSSLRKMFQCPRGEAGVSCILCEGGMGILNIIGAGSAGETVAFIGGTFAAGEVCDAIL